MSGSLQIIYVKAPSNQQIHAAVDGSAKIAYVAGGNYGQQAAEVSGTTTVGKRRKGKLKSNFF